MYYLGFDVGGSSIKYAVIDDAGSFLQKGSVPTPKTLPDFYDRLQTAKDKLAAQYELAGAGFSLPGAVDDKDGIIGGSSALPYIHDFPIRDALAAMLKLPIAMENDANCAALGEVWTGAGRDYQDVAFFVLGTGVGGALVHNKEIIHGAHLHGGEFGYIYVNERQDILSESGCSGALVRQIAKARNIPSDELDGRIIFQMAEEGDNEARRYIDDMYAHLARAIYDIQYIFDPEAFLIGGAISARADLIPGIEQHIDRIIHNARVARIRPTIIACQHGNDANLLGAVANLKQKLQR